MLQNSFLNNALRSGIVLCLSLSLTCLSSCSDDDNSDPEAVVLLSFDVANDQLVPAGEDDDIGEIGLVVLSDEDGNVIASSEYKNGDHVELKSSEFKGETFTVTEVLINSQEGYPVEFWTYPQVERGKWSVYHEQRELEDLTPATLDFTNGTDEYYRVVSNGNSLSMPGNLEGTVPAELIKSPSKLYVATQNSATNTYHLFPSVTSGANVTIDLSLVDQEVSKTTVDVPQGAEYLEVNLEGYAVAGTYDITERYRLGNYYNEESSAPVTVEYPGNAFPSYFSETYYSTANYYFSSGRTNAFYNITPFAYNVTFNISGGKLTCTSSGNYDFVTATFWKEFEGGETKWSFILPKGDNQSVGIPLLTETVEDLIAPYLADVDLASFIPEFSSEDLDYSIYEYEAIDGYQGLKNLIREATFGIADLVNKPTNYTQLDDSGNSGGRISTKSKIENRTARRSW